jgi:hypothetical protein
MSTKPNGYQPGGAHYQVEEGQDQHWDFMDRWDVSALEYAATKYMERIGKGKGTDLLDCQKARHYVEKILHEHETNGRPPRRYVPDYPISVYVRQHKLDGEQTVFFYKLLQWREAKNLRTAIAITEVMEKRLLSEQLPKVAVRENRTVDRTGQKHPFGYNDEE